MTGLPTRHHLGGSWKNGANTKQTRHDVGSSHVLGIEVWSLDRLEFRFVAQECICQDVSRTWRCGCWWVMLFATNLWNPLWFHQDISCGSKLKWAWWFYQMICEIRACRNLYNYNAHKNVPALDDFSLWVSRSNYCSTDSSIKQPRHEAGLYGECMFLCMWKLRHLLIYMLHHFTSFYQMFHYFSNCIRLFCWGPIAVSFIAAIWASSQSRPETRPRT